MAMGHLAKMEIIYFNRKYILVKTAYIPTSIAPFDENDILPYK